MEEEGRKRKRKKESKRGKGKAVGRETKSSCVTIINAIFKWALLLQYSSDGAKKICHFEALFMLRSPVYKIKIKRAKVARVQRSSSIFTAGVLFQLWNVSEGRHYLSARLNVNRLVIGTSFPVLVNTMALRGSSLE